MPFPVHEAKTPTSTTSSTYAGSSRNRNYRERLPKRSLKRSQIIDNVAVEQTFELIHPTDGHKVGDSCYISATVHNRRYSGILLEQGVIEAAAQLHLDKVASDLESTFKIKETHDKVVPEFMDGADVSRKIHGIEHTVEDESDRPIIGNPKIPTYSLDAIVVDNGKKRKLSTEINSKVAKQGKVNSSDELERCSPDATISNDLNPTQGVIGTDPDEWRMVQDHRVLKYLYVKPSNSVQVHQEPPSVDSQYLVASYSNIEAASEGNTEKIKSILAACQSGGSFVDGFFYQFERKHLALIAPSNDRNLTYPNEMQKSVDFRSLLQNVMLPRWFPPFNQKMGRGQQPLTISNLNKNSLEKQAAFSRKDLLPMEPRSRFRVCVVGGGIAGLACCLELLRECEKVKVDLEVVLLEARNRFGGRIWTDTETFKVPDSGNQFPLDLGASWIHGIVDNPLASLAQDAGVDFVSASEDVKMLQAGLKAVDDDKDERAGKLFDKLLDVAASTCWEMENDDKSNNRTQSVIRWYADSLTENPRSTIVKKIRSNVPSHRLSSDDSVDYAIGRVIAKDNLSEFAKLSEEERIMLLWNLKNVEYALGANVMDLSMKYWDIDSRHAFEGDHVLIRQGYGSVIDHLVRSLKLFEGRFKWELEFPVGTIEYARKTTTMSHPDTSLRNRLIDVSDTCRVTSQNGSKTYHCDFVVAAVPLGILKESLREQSPQSLKFQPPLPFVKCDAIKSVGFGLLNKVFLQFNKAFWRDYVEFGPDQNIFGNASGKNSHHYMFLDMGNIMNQDDNGPSPAILLSLVSGVDAIACECLSDKQLVYETVETLRILFSDSCVPEPIAYKISRWGSDPFARGSYTYLPPGTSDEDFQSLQSPINGNGDSLVLEGSEVMRLFFAGEHTTRLHPSMAHGAMLSGMRAALEVVTEMSIKQCTTDTADRIIPLSTYRHMNPKAALQCTMCHRPGTRIREGTLFAFKRGARQVLVHNNCAEFSPEVEVVDETWRNVLAAVNRSRTLVCFMCRQVGATIGCIQEGCSRCYHFSCGEDTGWRFERDGKDFKCDLHRLDLFGYTNRISMDFFLSKAQTRDSMVCSLCHTSDQCSQQGKFLAFQQQSNMMVVHENCARYTTENFANVGEDEMSHFDNEYRNIFSVVNKALKSFCHICDKGGASILCSNRECRCCFHYECGIKSGWSFVKRGPMFYCNKHRLLSSSTRVVRKSPTTKSFQHALISTSSYCPDLDESRKIEISGEKKQQQSYLDSDYVDLSDESDESDDEVVTLDNAFVPELINASRFTELGKLTYLTRPVNFLEPVLVRIFRDSVNDPWNLDLTVVPLREVSDLGGTSCLLTIGISAVNTNDFDPLLENDVIKSMNGVYLGSTELDSIGKVFHLLNQEVDVFLEVQRQPLQG